MWNGFAGDLIRRSVRAQLTVAAVLLLLSGGLVAANFAYLASLVRGARPATPDALLAGRSDDFFKLSPTHAYLTGITHRTTDKEHPSGYTDSQYYETVVGGRVLIVRIDGHAPTGVLDHPSFEGRLQPFSTTAGLESALKAALAEAPNLPPMLPLYLDTSEYRAHAIILMIVCGLALALAAWQLWLNAHISADFTRHRLARQLAGYGPLEAVVPQLDSEMAGAHYQFKRLSVQAHISQHWLVTAASSRANALKLTELAWAYRLIIKRKIYFLITVGKQESLVAWSKDGRKLQVQLGPLGVSEVLRELAQSAPDAIYGYNKPLAQLWKASKGLGFVESARALVTPDTVNQAATGGRYTAI